MVHGTAGTMTACGCTGSRGKEESCMFSSAKQEVAVWMK